MQFGGRGKGLPIIFCTIETAPSRRSVIVLVLSILPIRDSRRDVWIHISQGPDGFGAQAYISDRACFGRLLLHSLLLATLVTEAALLVKEDKSSSDRLTNRQENKRRKSICRPMPTRTQLSSLLKRMSPRVTSAPRFARRST